MDKNQPDLAAILRALSQSQPASKPSDVAPQGSRPTASTSEEALEEYDPSHFTPPPAASSTAPSHVSATRRAPITTTVRTPGSNAPAAADASKITIWAPALRHVTRLIARDPHVLATVQARRRDQGDHERRWWRGRETLLKAQGERGEGRKRIEEILYVFQLSRRVEANLGWFRKGVGGNVDSSLKGPSPEDDAMELKRYEVKVYKAVQSMHAAMLTELRGMGVPFFCTDDALILESDQEAAADIERISRNQLRALQLRMLETLEDLSGE